MSDPTHSPQKSNRLTALLLSAVDVLIAALIFVLPFLMGGREAWGHWFLISTSLLLGVCWAAYASVSGSRYRVTWLELFLITGLAIAWAQVQPLTEGAINQVSTEYERLLPTWSSTQNVSTHWSTVSLTPAETRHGWWMFLAYTIVFTVVFQRLQQAADCHRLLRYVAVVGISMTCFGLLQWATSNGRFFWFYQNPFTDTKTHLKGAFTNRNHFAQFLSLTIGPLMWWLFRDVRRFLEGTADQEGSGNAGAKPKKTKSAAERTFQQPDFRLPPGLPVLILGAGVVTVIVGVLLSFSRGGMIACGAVSIIAVVGLWRGLKPGGLMAGIFLCGSLALFSALAFSDQEQLQTKLDQLISADADQIDTGGNRRAIWAADAKVIRKFPLLGTGIGSHRDVYPLYMDNFAEFAVSEMTHAESSFVHLALETGLIGVGCLILCLLFVLCRLFVGIFRNQQPASRGCMIAVVASMAGAILHGVVDFIWYVPGIVVVSLILVAVGIRCATLQTGNDVDESRRPLISRLGWSAVACACMVALVAVQPKLFARIESQHFWYAALKTRLESSDDPMTEDFAPGDAVLTDIDDAPDLTPQAEADYATDLADRKRTATLRYLTTRIELIHRSLAAHPDHRIQLSLADHLLKLFDVLQVASDSPFPLKMLGDTARTAEFASAEELADWLHRNCGKRMKLLTLADQLTRDSLAGCPVQGRAYLDLLKTNFLRDPLNAQHQKLIDQAMLVRGHDPEVRFVAGHEAILRQDTETGQELWNSVFHSHQRYRLSILQMAAPQTTAEFFLQQFHPNAIEQKDILAAYESLNRDRDVQVVLKALCEAIPVQAPEIEDEDERLSLILDGYHFARRLNELELAITFLRNCVAEFPLAFQPRYLLGMTLVELERPDEAMEQLQWCYEQDPSNAYVPKLIVRARKQMLKDEPVTQR